jgi:ATP-dependent helicase/nuclease subunit A
VSGLQTSLPFSTPARREREAAPEPQRRNLVIEAGAGTGKTTAIVAEVLTLLLGDESLSPERIVLVTFTEKAAGEIADRIHAALADLASRFDQPDVAWPADSPNPPFRVPPGKRDSYRTACHAQLARIDSLRSQTIHSFCQTLLRQHPIEAGLDPQFKIVEGFERALLHDRMYDAWLDHETRIDPKPEHLADWELLLAAFGHLRQIGEAIFDLLDRRDLLGEDLALLGTVEEAEESMLDAVTAIRSWQPSGAELQPELRRIVDYVRATRLPTRGSLDGWIDYFAPIADDICGANLPKKEPILKEALNLLRVGDKGDSIHDRLTSHRIAVALYRMASRFVAFLDEEKRKLGVVDFDDLLLRSRDLLDDELVLERVRNQYDYIFVDEFQDTDRVQADIIDRLSRGRDGRAVPGKITIVGDPKQSIYGFRRADPETYYQTRERLISEGGDIRQLSDQYRSDEPLVAAINTMFGQLFPPRPDHDVNVFRPTYHPLRAGRRTAGNDEPRLTFLVSSSQDKDEQVRAEAESIAAWIASQRDHDPAHDLRRFAILLRRLTHVDDYLDALGRFGIDHVLPPTRQFLERRTAVDLLAVLRAIAYPFDRGAEIAAARSPYFALTDDEIAAGVLEAKDSSSVPRFLGSSGENAGDLNKSGGFGSEPQVSHPEIVRSHPPDRLAQNDGTEEPRNRGTEEPSAYATFLAAMRAYRDAARHLTVSELVTRIVDDCRIEELYQATADTERSIRHLEHLRSIAFAYDRRTGGSLAQFVDEIASRRVDPDEAEPPLSDDTQNAVRVMTIHAAKGLEFETVIIPDLGFDKSNEGMDLYRIEQPRSLVMRGRAKSLSNYFRLANGDKLKAIQSQREEAEMHRLFYVAVTRAKGDVVFCANPDAFRKKGFWKCMGELFGLDKALLAARCPSGPERRVDTLHVGNTAVPVAFARMDEGDEKTRRRRRLSAGVDEEAIRASTITPAPVPGPAPLIEELDFATAAERGAGNRNKAAGILLHRILELWDGAPASLEKLVASVAREQGADERDRRRVQQRLLSLSRSETLARVRACQTAGRELTVWYEQDGARVEGRVDRLLREEGRLIVLDYKSGKAGEQRLVRDTEQVRSYCRAIARMTGQECRGALWYIDLVGDQWVDVPPSS